MTSAFEQAMGFLECPVCRGNDHCQHKRDISRAVRDLNTKIVALEHARIVACEQARTAASAISIEACAKVADKVATVLGDPSRMDDREARDGAKAAAELIAEQIRALLPATAPVVRS